MSAISSETRSEVLYAEDLLALLCAKTAAEYKLTMNRSYPKPPLGSVIITGALTLLCLAFNQPGASYFFGVITLIQGGWCGVALAIRINSDAEDKVQAIEKGSFPPESAALIVNRLRWWNHLIVPQNWARFSRIHDRKYQLENRVKELQKRINHLLAEQQDRETIVAELPQIDHVGLAMKITCMAERIKQEQRINAIGTEHVRLVEEQSLYQALLHKIKEITSQLERIDQLALPNRFESSNLGELVGSVVAKLEERRRLVLAVDSVNPDEFLLLVSI